MIKTFKFNANWAKYDVLIQKSPSKLKNHAKIYVSYQNKCHAPLLVLKNHINPCQFNCFSFPHQKLQPKIINIKGNNKKRSSMFRKSKKGNQTM